MKLSMKFSSELPDNKIGKRGGVKVYPVIQLKRAYRSIRRCCLDKFQVEIIFKN